MGAQESISVDDPKVKRYIKEGLKNYRGEREPIVVKVQSATVQLVAGDLYKIHVSIGSSNCIRGTTDLSNCKLDSTKPIEECLITAWVRAWVNNGAPQITLACN